MTKPLTDDGSPEKAGLPVGARIFLVIAALVLAWFVIYWFLSYEPAGTVLLLLAAAMAAMIGGYLFLQARRAADPSAVGPAADSHYLPHASVWPFAVAMGAILLGNGLALGFWAVAPGAILLAYGVWGYARQSRRRD
jgi:hypothetical protein